MAKKAAATKTRKRPAAETNGHKDAAPGFIVADDGAKLHPMILRPTEQQAKALANILHLAVQHFGLEEMPNSFDLVGSCHDWKKLLDAAHEARRVPPPEPSNEPE